MFRRLLTRQRSLLLLLNTLSAQYTVPLRSATTVSSSSSIRLPAMDQPQFTVSFVTTPDEKTAKEIALALVQKKLAACVNILPQVTSIYTWEDKINEDHEAMMIIKTTMDKTDALIQFVKENHPYSVAEVISIPIAKGNEPYLDWLRKSVEDK